MQYTFARYQESADHLKERLGPFRPEVAMILGSGLGFLGDQVEAPIAVSYGEIPCFKASTAPQGPVLRADQRMSEKYVKRLRRIAPQLFYFRYS